MVFVKWSDKVEGYGENIDSPLFGGLYKEEEDSLVTWSGTDTDSEINCFTWSKEENDCIFQEISIINNSKKWRVPIHNGQSKTR